MSKLITKLVVMPKIIFPADVNDDSFSENENHKSSRNFTGGDGTATSPYLISNVNDLNNVRNYLGSNIHFKLTQDINVSSIKSWEPIGNEKNKFEGTFDGNHFSISHLTINRASRDYIGFFGYMGNEGTIENLILENINIIGNDYVGGVVGLNSGCIHGCYVTGHIIGNEAVGGIVGYNSVGTIKNCQVRSRVIGYDNVGGVIGHNSVGTIVSSFSKGVVIGDNAVGGLVGYNFVGTIDDSYAKGSVKGSNNAVGALIGADIGGEVNNSYAICSVQGQYNIGGLIGFNSGSVKLGSCEQ